jgi:hypothetical protein
MVLFLFGAHEPSPNESPYDQRLKCHADAVKKSAFEEIIRIFNEAGSQQFSGREVADIIKKYIRN